ATPATKIAVTAIADQVCRDVGGSVANPTSISSVSLRAIIVPRAAAMARRMIWLYAYQHSRYATICLVAGQSANRLPTRIVGYWTVIGGSVNDDVRFGSKADIRRPVLFFLPLPVRLH